MKKVQKSSPRYLFLKIHEENVKLNFVLAVAPRMRKSKSSQLLTTPYCVLINTYFDALRFLNRKDHLPVFLDYVLKGSEEILLKAKIGQLPFFQKLHSQLTQGVHAEKRNIFVRITATLKEIDAFRILRNSNDKFPCHMHPYDEMWYGKWARRRLLSNKRLLPDKSPLYDVNLVLDAPI